MDIQPPPPKKNSHLHWHSTNAFIHFLGSLFTIICFCAKMKLHELSVDVSCYISVSQGLQCAVTCAHKCGMLCSNDMCGTQFHMSVISLER